jgi:hypothetical protein
MPRWFWLLVPEWVDYLWAAAPNQLRVVFNVDHSVHAIRDPKRVASMQARIGLGYVG